MSIKTRIEKYAESLDGISYSDWEWLRHVIDSSFDKIKKEHEENFTLSFENDAKKIIRSRFGCE